MISLSPSTTWPSNSCVARPIFLPGRSVDRVRTWLIFTHERFPSPSCEGSSSINGNPARCSWLVMAMAMTVPDRSLKTSRLNTTTGR